MRSDITKVPKLVNFRQKINHGCMVQLVMVLIMSLDLQKVVSNEHIYLARVCEKWYGNCHIDSGLELVSSKGKKRRNLF